MIDIQLPKKLMDKVDVHAQQEGVTAPEQIEKWIHLGMIAEEHPELTLSFLKELNRSHK